MLERNFCVSETPPTLLPHDSLSLAELLAGCEGFMRWASQYGYQLKLANSDHPLLHSTGAGELLLLSDALSASFNLGYDAADQSMFLAVESDEFEWLQYFPIRECFFNSDGERGSVLIVSNPVDFGDGNVFPSVVIQVVTDQPRLWQAFPHAKDIGLMNVLVDNGGVTCIEYSQRRYPFKLVS